MIKNKSYYLFLMLLFGIFVFVESRRPKEIDWSYNFSGSGKMPYGCFVLHNILPKIYTNTSIVDNYDNIYDWINTCKFCTDNSLIILTGNLNVDSIEYKYLAAYVSSGNKVFISAFNFCKIIRDSLQFNTEYSAINKFLKSQRTLNFTMPELKIDKGYKYYLNIFEYFSKFDTSRTVVLANDSGNHATFIKISLGRGAFYLSSTPLLFTNYHILYDNSDYAFKCLSFVKNNLINWDDYYKPEGASVFKSSSPLRYILSKPPLKSAYYLLLFTALTYILLEGRRKQKMIPVYQRPANNSLEFIKTVSMLFFNRRKNKNLAEKRIIYFYDYIYNHYYIRFDENNSSFIKILSEKSNVSETLIIRIFNTIQWIRKQKEISEAELFDFIGQTDTFMNY